jgi:hypothetical protein
MTDAIKQAREETEYDALAAPHPAPCISIYASNGPGTDVAKSRLPSLLGQLQTVEEKLRNTELPVEKAQRILNADLPSVEERESGITAGEGLAVFISPASFGYRYVPAHIGNQITVGREFLVRPLLEHRPANDQFFVLALSQNHVALYEGRATGIHQRTLQAVPKNLRESLSEPQFEGEYGMKRAPGEAGRRGPVFHEPTSSHKDKVLHFFQKVAQGVEHLLKGQEAPLIVASVDYVFPIYRRANTYPHLQELTIGGNPDLLSPGELHKAAWKIFQRHASATSEKAFAVYVQHADTNLTSRNLREVLIAAHRGLVRFLFIPSSGEHWGSLDLPETVHVHESPEAGDEDLLNLAAILTIRHHGHVYVLPPERLPEGASIAAVFRFGTGSHVSAAD